MDYTSDPLDAQNQISNFWEMVRMEVEATKADQVVFKAQELPLARIKKIMKLDDDVKCMMISAEAPILFAKAAELFIRELTLRAWIHTERNRRRTLHRNDIALAVSDSDTDQFDFLIDIVPRDDSRSHRRGNQNASNNLNTTTGSIGDGVNVDSNKLASILDGQNVVDISNQGGVENIVLNGNNIITSNGNLGAGQNIQFVTSQNGNSNGQQVQYVLQLPNNSITNNNSAPFQIQMVQPGLQSLVSNDNISLANGLPPGTIIQQGPNGTLQLVNILSSNNQTNQSPNQDVSNNDESNSLANGDSEETNKENHSSQQNDNQIDTKINIQLTESQVTQSQLGGDLNNQTIVISQDGNLVNDSLSHQQLIYTPVGSNQPVIISLSDAIASGLISEMPSSDMIQDSSDNVANIVEISSSDMVEASSHQVDGVGVIDSMVSEDEVVRRLESNGESNDNGETMNQQQQENQQDESMEINPNEVANLDDSGQVEEVELEGSTSDENQMGKKFVKIDEETTTEAANNVLDNN